MREAGDATDLDDDVDDDWEDMPEHWGGGDTVPPATVYVSYCAANAGRPPAVPTE